MKYTVLKAGDWVTIDKHGQKLGCCGCGLVHRFQIRVKGPRVQWRLFHEKRATAALRREREKR